MVYLIHKLKYSYIDVGNGIKIAELQEAENTRIYSNFCMALAEDVLLWTLITMVQKVFEKNI